MSLIFRSPRFPLNMADSQAVSEQQTNGAAAVSAAPIHHLQSDWRRRAHQIVSLAAALVAPFSVLFALPGLTEQW